MLNDLQAELQRRTAQHEVEIASYQAAKDRLTSQLEGVHEDARLMGEASVSMEKELEETRRKMKQLREEGESRREIDRRDVGRLQSELSLALENAETLSEARHDLEKTTETLHEELRRTRATYEDQLNQLRAELAASASAQARGDELQHTAELASNRLKHRVQELERELERQHDDLNTLLRVNEQQTSAYQVEVNKLQESVRQIGSENSDLRNSVSRLRKQNEEMGRNLKEGSELDAKTIQTLRNEIAALDEELTTTLTEKNKLQRSNNQMALLLQQQGQQHQASLSTERENVEELRLELRDMTERLQQCHLEADRMKRNIADLTRELAQQKEDAAVSAANDQQTIDFVRSELASCTTDLQAANTENDALKRTIGRLEIDLQFHSQELTTAQEIERQNVESMQLELDEALESLRRSRHEASGLTWQLEDLERQLRQGKEEHEMTLEHNQKTIQSLRAEITGREAEASHAEGEVEDLRALLREAEGRAASAEEEHHMAVQRLEDMLLALRGEVTQATDALAETEGLNQQLRRRVNELEGALGQAQRDKEVTLQANRRSREELSEQIEALREGKRQAEAGSAAWESRAKVLEGEVQHVRSQLDMAESDTVGKVSSLQEAVEAKGDVISALEAEVKSLQRVVQQQQDMLVVKENAVEEARRGSTEASMRWETDREEILRELHVSEAGRKEGMQRMSALEEELEKLRVSHEAMQVDAEKVIVLEEKVDLLTRQLSASEKTCGQLQLQVEELQEEANQLEKERKERKANSRRELAALTDEKDELTEQVQLYKDEVTSLRYQLEKSKAASQATRRLQRQLEEVQAELELNEQQQQQRTDGLEDLQRRFKEVSRNAERDAMRLEVAEWELTTLHQQAHALSTENKTLRGKLQAQAERRRSSGK